MSRMMSLMVPVLLLVAILAHAQEPAKQPPQDKPKSNNLGSDKNGNPLRLAFKTGHVSNYDESKVKPYTLPDPLVLSSGQPVKDADTWFQKRRPEILKLFQTEIFGRVPVVGQVVEPAIQPIPIALDQHGERLPVALLSAVDQHVLLVGKHVQIVKRSQIRHLIARPR